MQTTQGGMIMKFRLKRLMGMLSAAAMACTCLAGLPDISESQSVSAAPSSYRFDFGAGGTETDTSEWMHPPAILRSEAMASGHREI